ncbi:sigma-E factor negative regulatory protein [Zobellella sp. DQSA1]|uniref:sigma-E factor negative regulatory protein n=1 Tax=Zobellella sp. DQSA1 TaxID=3342386 RepID=UPI0035C1236B
MANKEHISALVDGEIQDKVLLERLGRDSELAETFGRYHLYGDAMRNELPNHLQLDLSDRIAAALEQEPAILAAPAPAGDAGEPRQARMLRPLRVAPLVRQLGQFAVAASVSAAVIFGVQQYSQNDPHAPVLNTVPLSGGAAPVSLNYQADSREALNEQALLEQQRKIHALLMDHELQQRLRQN